MTPTETRYAQIEKEALALTWAFERSWECIVGNTITVEIDHKPLIPLVNTHTLDQLPPRIQRLRMWLMRFHFKEIKHVPGKKIYIADALSRLPSQKQNNTVYNWWRWNVHTHRKCVLLRYQTIADKWSTGRGSCLQTDQNLFSSGMAWQTFAKRCHETILQDILLKASRILIPSSMHLEILDEIHKGHQGITKCCERVKSSIGWPGLSREIQDLVQQCRVCALHKKNKPELLKIRENKGLA